MWFHERNAGLYVPDIYGLISFQLGMVTEMTKLYILMSVWVSLAFIQGHS